MLFGAYMLVQLPDRVAKFSARVEALSWEEAADRAEELGLIPSGPILMAGRCEPFEVDEYYPEVEKMPPCPKNLRHRFHN